MLRVQGVQHHFGARQVLDQIDFSLDTGRILVILGPNGAGKTTLLRLLCGILPVQQGRIEFDEEAALEQGGRSRWRGQVGLLTESPGLYEVLSVRENLEVFARLQGLDHLAARRRVAQEAERFGLSGRLDERCGVLSKGLKQRVALVRALLHQPRLLLLDEPTSGLDPEAASQLRQWLDQLRGSGCTLILTTHDLDEAQRLGDEILVLNRRLLRLPPSSQGLRLRVEQAADWLSWLQSRGWQVTQAGPAELLLGAAAEPVPELLSALCAAGARVHGLLPESTDLLERYRGALAQLADAA